MSLLLVMNSILSGNKSLSLKCLKRNCLYRESTTVNWCEDCHTVLANEQVEEGCCWRCDNEVQLKEMPGYYLDIIKYADELAR